MQKKYDIIVAGCGCAGFAAAVQAGRLGKNVLIIEKNGMPGGIMTVGGNNDVAQFYAHQNQIIAGIGWEFVNLLKEEGGAVIPDMHKTGVPHWYYGVHVNIPLAAAKMDEMLLDAGVDICYEQFICAANVESDRDGKKISSILVTSKSGLVEIGADVFIDCTGDGDLSVFAGADYECGEPTRKRSLASARNNPSVSWRQRIRLFRRNHQCLVKGFYRLRSTFPPGHERRGNPAASGFALQQHKSHFRIQRRGQS